MKAEPSIDDVLEQIADVLEQWQSEHMSDETPLPTREEMTKLFAPRLAAQKWRFSSDYRHGKTAAHRLVYCLLWTVGCNFQADDLTKEKGVEHASNPK